jgi:hypothetical protein
MLHVWRAGSCPPRSEFGRRQILGRRLQTIQVPPGLNFLTYPPWKILPVSSPFDNTN